MLDKQAQSTQAHSTMTEPSSSDSGGSHSNGGDNNNNNNIDNNDQHVETKTEYLLFKMSINRAFQQII